MPSVRPAAPASRTAARPFNRVLRRADRDTEEVEKHYADPLYGYNSRGHRVPHDIRRSTLNLRF